MERRSAARPWRSWSCGHSPSLPECLFRRTLDALAPSLALGLGIASIGAFAGGSNFGTPTNLPWAVTYTSRLASLWNGAPLGIPLHPVQIYVALAELSIFSLLLVMIAKRKRWKVHAGEIMGAWLFLHGAASFNASCWRYTEQYEVVIVGAGHAGCEAAMPPRAWACAPRSSR
jgi:phosphatidylglycerol:prolipoprotein diacylglycerol transferase